MKTKEEAFATGGIIEGNDQIKISVNKSHNEAKYEWQKKIFEKANQVIKNNQFMVKFDNLTTSEKQEILEYMINLE